MALRLFYAPRTRASRPRWLLEEMGLPYELVRFDPKNKPSGYEALHPLSHVPVLQDGDFVLFESAAIILYLADKDPAQRFIGAPGTPERGHCYQWMFYLMTEVEPQVSAYENQAVRAPQPDPARVEAIRTPLNGSLRGLASGLAEKPFLLGDQLNAVDIVAGAILAWAHALKLLGDFPTLIAYTERLMARDAYKRARSN